jgi:peptide/nickel transport system permease protein
MVLTNPLLPSIYIINDLSPHYIAKNESDYTYLSEGKYNAAQLFSFSNLNLVIKTLSEESFQKSGKKVSEIIGNTLPSTAILAFFAIVIAIVFGILFGIISALHKDTWIDRLIALVSTLGMSIPPFLVPFYLLGYLVLYCTNIQT